MTKSKLLWDSCAGLVPIKILDVWQDAEDSTLVAKVELLEDREFLGKVIYCVGDVKEVLSHNVVRVIPSSTKYRLFPTIGTVPVQTYWTKPIRKRRYNWNTGKWTNCTK